MPVLRQEIRSRFEALAPKDKEIPALLHRALKATQVTEKFEFDSLQQSLREGREVE